MTAARTKDSGVCTPVLAQLRSWLLDGLRRKHQGDFLSNSIPKFLTQALMRTQVRLHPKPVLRHSHSKMVLDVPDLPTTLITSKLQICISQVNKIVTKLFVK